MSGKTRPQEPQASKRSASAPTLQRPRGAAARLGTTVVRSHAERILVDFVDPTETIRRAPLRRLVGDSVSVCVELACDGDAVPVACICYRVPGEPRWRFAPMQPENGAPHRWRGHLRLQSGGRYRVSVEAWVDRFATVLDRAARALTSGQDVDVARRALHDVLRAAAARADGQDREVLEARATALVSGQIQDADALQALCGRQLAKRMWVYGDRLDMVRVAPGFEITVDRKRAGFAAWWIGPVAKAPEAAPATPWICDDSLATLARLGVDVLCVASVANLAPPPARARRRAGARVEAGTRQEIAARIELARRMRLEVAVDFNPASSPGTDIPIAAAAVPPMWLGDRQAAWNQALASLQQLIAHGVHVFRLVDAERQPLPFWAWLIERIKRAHPEVVFVAAGNPTTAQETALARLGISASWPRERWSSSQSLSTALCTVTEPEVAQLLRAHWTLCLAEPRQADDTLATRLQRQRLFLATMLSPTCCFESADPIPAVLQNDLRTLLRIRRENRALQLTANVRVHASDNERVLFFSRSIPQQRNDVLVAVNLDAEHAQEARLEVPLGDLGLQEDTPYEVDDLLHGTRVTWRGSPTSLRLDPGQCPGHVFRLVRRRRLGEPL